MKGPTVATSAPAPIPTLRDEPSGFPVGGAVLLIALLAAAVWAWWHGRSAGRRGTVAMAPRWRSWMAKAPSPSGELRILESAMPAPGLRVLVIEWSGGKLLVGVNGSSAPVRLARTETAPSDAGRPSA